MSVHPVRKHKIATQMSQTLHRGKQRDRLRINVVIYCETGLRTCLLDRSDNEYRYQDQYSHKMLDGNRIARTCFVIRRTVRVWCPSGWKASPVLFSVDDLYLGAAKCLWEHQKPFGVELVLVRSGVVSIDSRSGPSLSSDCPPFRSSALLIFLLSNIMFSLSVMHINAAIVP